MSNSYVPWNLPKCLWWWVVGGGWLVVGGCVNRIYCSALAQTRSLALDLCLGQAEQYNLYNRGLVETCKVAKPVVGGCSEVVGWGEVITLQRIMGKARGSL